MIGLSGRNGMNVSTNSWLLFFFLWMSYLYQYTEIKRCNSSAAHAFTNSGIHLQVSLTVWFQFKQ